MTLIPFEQETIIRFNEAEWGASVETFSDKVARRMAKEGIDDIVEKSAIIVKVGNRSIRLTGQSKMKDPSKPITDEAYESGTIIGFNEESPDAEIYTAGSKVKNRLVKGGLTPDPNRIGKIDGVECAWYFYVPKHNIGIKEGARKCNITGRPF